jgi:cobalt-precorrin 5A hydrolase
MKIAVISVTGGGRKTAETISRALEEHEVEVLAKPASLKETVGQIFKEYDALVFITALGIVVRTVADYIKDKKTDPAVVVLDEKGKFTISLLSGHLGGANDLTNLIAKRIKSTPVITTATDVLGRPSVEGLSKALHMKIENFEASKIVNSAIVNGRKVGIASDIKLDLELPEEMPRVGLNHNKGNFDALVVITNKKVNIKVPHVFLRPKNLIAGIGTKKGISKENVLAAVDFAFKLGNLSILSLKALSVPDFKAKENGILKASKELGIPLMEIPTGEIKRIEDSFEPSKFALNKVGLKAVSEPCAVLGGKSAKLLQKKIKLNGVTVAVAEEA